MNNKNPKDLIKIKSNKKIKVGGLHNKAVLNHDHDVTKELEAAEPEVEIKKLLEKRKHKDVEVTDYVPELENLDRPDDILAGDDNTY